MALKQTRRAVSLNRGIYEKLKAHCRLKEVSMASMVESLILVELEIEELGRQARRDDEVRRIQVKLEIDRLNGEGGCPCASCIDTALTGGNDPQ